MHNHSHHPVPDSYTSAFLIGIALNTVFISIEAYYGFVANSLALLADAGHNATDVVGLAVAWGAIWLAKRQASERFTYGLQSASIVATLINALLLLAAVGGIGAEAIQRLSNPVVPSPPIVIVVAAIGAVVNSTTAWLLYKGRDDLNIRSAFLHMAADAIISLGIVVSGLFMMTSGFFWIDSAVSLAIVTLIVLGTWPLLMDSIALALHGVPRHIDAAAVRSYLTGLPGVAAMHDLHIWAVSTADSAMTAHLVMPGGHPGDGFISNVAQAMHDQFRIHHATFQIELGDGGSVCETHAHN